MRHQHLKRTAIHEAGHVVMHYLERVPFESVTIVPDPVTGSDGAVHPRLGPLSLWDRQRPKTLRILMAGKVAEEFHTGRPVTRSCGHDLNLAACIADELADEGSSDADALLAAAYVAARHTLAAASVWAAVEALASALVLRQTLNKTQAYRVIRHALPKGVERC
jgi:ATP-dependent Zn protease